MVKLFIFQAAQQGHSQIVYLLLDANASPNTVSNVSLASQPRGEFSPAIPGLNIKYLQTREPLFIDSHITAGKMFFFSRKH